MSRTYRNKSTVPHGWEVRDDGCVYCNSCCPTQEARRKKNFWQPGCGVSRRDFYRDLEHCECWKGPPKFRSHVYRKERKAERKAHYRSYRAKVKDRMRHADWDNIPRFRRTSGWLTW